VKLYRIMSTVIKQAIDLYGRFGTKPLIAYQQALTPSPHGFAGSCAEKNQGGVPAPATPLEGIGVCIAAIFQKGTPKNRGKFRVGNWGQGVER